MIILAGVIGACIGSFLNVVIDRLPVSKNIFISRSVCEHCKKKIKWYDLIPIVSFILLSGKCRSCKAKIPTRILLVEVTTALIFSLLAYMFLPGSFPDFLFFATMFSLLIPIFFIDLKYGIIPDRILVLIFAVTVVFYLFTSPTLLLNAFITGFVTLLFFLFLFVITRQKGIGFGDVKFAFIIGFLLSYPGAIFAIYTAFLTGAVVSIILILIGKKRFRKDSVPFGPFLVIGIIMSYIFQDFVKKIFASFGL